MANPDNTDAVAGIDALIEGLEAKLRQDPTYRQLEILRDTRRRLTGLSAQPSEAAKHTIAQAIEAMGMPNVTITIRAAVTKALTTRGMPMGTKELVAILPKYGKTVGGANPVTNLASILTKDDTFQFVRTDTVKGWWLKNMALPAPLLGNGETDAGASAPKH